jgi:maleylacetoacetate isomerase
LKKISFRLEPVHLVQEGQLKEDYIRLNPMRQVPTLEIDGNTLTQSLSILEYLEETHPEPPLLPKDHLAKAKVRSLALIIAADIQPVQNLRVLKKLGVSSEEKTAWAKHWIENGFTGTKCFVIML